MNPRTVIITMNFERSWEDPSRLTFFFVKILHLIEMKITPCCWFVPQIWSPAVALFVYNLTLWPLSGTKIQFLLTISPLNHTLRSREWRDGSPTEEALDFWTNSPYQHLRKCRQINKENMHTIVRVWRVKWVSTSAFDLKLVSVLVMHGCHLLFCRAKTETFVWSFSKLC